MLQMNFINSILDNKSDKYIYLKYYMSVLFFSVVVAATFYSFFSERISKKLFPSRNIEIIVHFDESLEMDSTIGIYSFVSSADLWDEINKADKTDNWEFVFNDENDQRWITTGHKGISSIKFNRKEYTHEYIDVSCSHGSGVVEIKINDKGETYTLAEGDNIINLYDDKCELKVTIINCIVFGVALLGLFILFLGILQMKLSGIFNRGLLGKEYGIWSLWVFTAIFLVWGYLGYNYGIDEYFTGYGDQAFYWYDNNPLNPFNSAKSLDLPHRGYLCKWICTICIRLGNAVGVRGEIFWIFYLCILHGAFFGYVLPRIYEKISGGNKVYLCQLILMSFIYMFGAFGYLPMGKVADAAGLIFFFCSIWALLEVEEKGGTYALYSGFFMAAAISYRMTYKHALYVGILIILFYIIISIRQKGNTGIFIYVRASVLFVIGLVFVSIPQIYGNFSNGVYTIFPYTYEGTNQALTTSSWGLQAGLLVFGYPYGATDSTFIDMATREGLVNYSDSYSIMTVLSVLSSQWLDTIIYIFKKLFFGFSPVCDISYGSLITGYPNSYPFKHATEFAIIPMINYVLMGISCYILLIKNKYLSIKEKIMFWWIFLSLILPQTFTHVEWRYFLPGYILIYCLSIFKSQDISKKVLEERGKLVWMDKISKVIVFVSVYVVASEALLWTFY